MFTGELHLHGEHLSMRCSFVGKFKMNDAVMVITFAVL